jgi:PHD/YefM family antitoxin component YafN of YafNO toxin-antitoxin module
MKTLTLQIDNSLYDALLEILKNLPKSKIIIQEEKTDDNACTDETTYLLRNPAGAQRLLESVEELRAGQGTVRELINAD